jgi:hypothetical protein
MNKAVSTARPFSFRSRAEFVGEKWSKNAELIVFHYADRLALTDCEEEISHKSKKLDRAFRSNALFVLLLVLRPAADCSTKPTGEIKRRFGGRSR